MLIKNLLVVITSLVTYILSILYRIGIVRHVEMYGLRRRGDGYGLVWYGSA